MKLRLIEILCGNNKKMVIECKNVDDVYSSKDLLAKRMDNHQFYFYDGTQGVLKRFRIRSTYIDPEVVRSIEDLRTSCTDINRPSQVSVILPLMPTIGLDDETTMHFLQCSDCANIIKVAKDRDFRRNQPMDKQQSDTVFSFSFGERVLDTTTKETTVVVGQTRTCTYVISESSIIENMRSKVSITPKRVATKRLSTIMSTKALNFRVVQECALMEDYIVPNSEGPYAY